MKLTVAEENYILAIHRLSNGERVSTNQLAQEIGIAAASVTDMVQKLAEKEFVRYEKYKGVTLLPTGLRIAQKLSTTQTLWREFLTDHLQLSKPETERLLEQLQHVESPHFATQFKAYLKQEFEPAQSAIQHPAEHKQRSTSLDFQQDLFASPTPITQKEQYIEPINAQPIMHSNKQKTLADCTVGQSIFIIGVETNFKQAEELFELLTLPIGVKFQIKAIHQFDKTISLINTDNQYLISQKLASILIVTE